MHKQIPRSGFTIVELLVVIVVIGVLASLVVVAYNGVQQRAYNAKVVSGVNAYLKALYQYKAINDSYPATTSACLGANYPNNACWAANPDGTVVGLAVNATLDTALSQYIQNKPEVGTELISIAPLSNQYRGGAFYYGSGVAYATSAPLVGYYLKGNNANCTIKVSQQNNEGTMTQCLIGLP